ncbi:MAG TPA: AraC family transcriptional regulator, partial [Prolixibacteraceae bacterium]|nr:AraC family transcriptional regulator [Prolixibacteraceae bacterium]
LSLVILEDLLNYTGLITRMISFDNFAEPLNFVLAPLSYFYIIFGLYPEKKPNIWPHFVFFGFYLFYCIFYYAQPDAFKFNSFLYCYHPELPQLPVMLKFSPDPLGMRTFVNEMILVQIAFYLALSGKLLLTEYKKLGLRIWNLNSGNIGIYRNFALHVLAIALLVLIVKATFGRDIGDYFIASYCAFLLYLTSFSIINRSSFFSEALNENMVKYQKSSLNDHQKEEILLKLETVMTRDAYYRSNLASLSDISDRVNESQHRVSQVINEKTGMNFYSWLATYRIEEAKKVLSGPESMKLKIDEIAEMVGYNSKASFNKVFKTITGQTPSEFRNASRAKS